MDRAVSKRSGERRVHAGVAKRLLVDVDGDGIADTNEAPDRLGIDLAEVASQGYCFQVDLVWRAWQEVERDESIEVSVGAFTPAALMMEAGQ